MIEAYLMHEQERNAQGIPALPLNPEQTTDGMKGLDEAALMYIADNAGGAYGYANDEESLQNLYRSYAVALQSEYVLTYTSPNDLRDGVNRALSVSLVDAAAAEQYVYNPGGLIPEVAEPASWTLFFSLLVALLGLLALPSLVKAGMGILPPGASANGRKPTRKAKPKIKFIDKEV